MAETAVFDLDGTLLAGDSTAFWLRDLLFASWLRVIAAVLTLPATVPLIWFRSSRRIGASILLWIATLGLDQKAIGWSIEYFAQDFAEGTGGLRWRNDGLETLKRHLAAGDRVVVVTAAPVWLAQRLLAFRPDVQVLGSTLAHRWGGWITDHHCHGKAKVRILEQSGYGTSWAYAYTDSYDDAPLLGAATKGAFLVNARPRVVGRFAANAQSRISPVSWT